MSDYLDKFLDAPEDHGMQPVTPAGQYPVQIEAAEGSCNKNPERTSIRARLQLRILDGPYAGRVVFVDKYLANLFDPDHVQNKPKYYNQTATLIKVIGAKLNEVEPSSYESLGAAAVACYDVENKWVGAKFIADVAVDSVEKQWKSISKRAEDDNVEPSVDASQLRDRNTLDGWHAWEGKNGYEAWKKKVLPRQNLQAGVNSGTSPNRTAGPSSAPAVL